MESPFGCPKAVTHCCTALAPTYLYMRNLKWKDILNSFLKNTLKVLRFVGSLIQKEPFWIMLGFFNLLKAVKKNNISALRWVLVKVANISKYSIEVTFGVANIKRSTAFETIGFHNSVRYQIRGGGAEIVSVKYCEMRPLPCLSLNKFDFYLAKGVLSRTYSLIEKVITYRTHFGLYDAI